jgi:hypothetical protein
MKGLEQRSICRGWVWAAMLAGNSFRSWKVYLGRHFWRMHTALTPTVTYFLALTCLKGFVTNPDVRQCNAVVPLTCHALQVLVKHQVAVSPTMDIAESSGDWLPTLPGFWAHWFLSALGTSCWRASRLFLQWPCCSQRLHHQNTPWLPCLPQAGMQSIGLGR